MRALGTARAQDGLEGAVEGSRLWRVAAVEEAAVQGAAVQGKGGDCGRGAAVERPRGAHLGAISANLGASSGQPRGGAISANLEAASANLEAISATLEALEQRPPRALDVPLGRLEQRERHVGGRVRAEGERAAEGGLRAVHVARALLERAERLTRRGGGAGVGGSSV